MEEAGKGSFVLYTQNITQINILTDEQAGKLIKGIFSYVESHVEPDFEDGMVKMAFSFIKQYLDKDAEKWSETREKRVEAGRKGGKQTKANLSNAKECLSKQSSVQQTQANQAVSVYESDSVINNPPISPKGDERNKDLLEKSFDIFLKSYPNKKSKANALSVWKELKPNDDLVRVILDAVERQKKSEQWQKEDGQFISYPAKWLRDKRWEDEECVIEHKQPDKAYSFNLDDYKSLVNDFGDEKNG